MTRKREAGIARNAKVAPKSYKNPLRRVVSGGKRAEGKGKQPTTKRTQAHVVKQREQRTRSQQVHYNFSEDEEGLHDTDDETQGYVCVSADPRRSGSAEGGEIFIITAKELRLSLQAQRTVEDQTVWMTTAQAGFPTTATEGELDNDLDRQMGKPTARCLHPVISAFILQRQQELATQDRAPSLAETRALELEREWDTQEVRRRIRTGTQTLVKIPPGNRILSP